MIYISKNHSAFKGKNVDLHLILGLEDGDNISLLLLGAHDALRVVREHNLNTDTDGTFVGKKVHVKKMFLVQKRKV